jgi:hypothetical protein
VVKYSIKWKDKKDGKEVRRKQEIKRARMKRASPMTPG